jgi:hypothetical protein
MIKQFQFRFQLFPRFCECCCAKQSPILRQDRVAIPHAAAQARKTAPATASHITSHPAHSSCSGVQIRTRRRFAPPATDDDDLSLPADFYRSVGGLSEFWNRKQIQILVSSSWPQSVSLVVSRERESRGDSSHHQSINQTVKKVSHHIMTLAVPARVMMI